MRRDEMDLGLGWGLGGAGLVRRRMNCSLAAARSGRRRVPKLGGSSIM